MGASISANHGNHCFINSKRGDRHPVNNSDPTRTRTYIHPTPPLPAGLLIRPVRALYFLLALQLPRSNPTRYKYPTQSIHWHTSFTCLWSWNRQWVSKRRQLELRRRGITQKETDYDFRSIKNPLTPPGIEPATFRFVAQQLNHCATAVYKYKMLLK